MPNIRFGLREVASKSIFADCLGGEAGPAAKLDLLLSARSFVGSEVRSIRTTPTY